MSSYRSEILQFPNRVMYAELEAYRINIWANVFPMICCYDLCIHIPQSAHHETDSNSRIELDLFPIIDFGNWNRFPSLHYIQQTVITRAKLVLPPTYNKLLYSVHLALDWLFHWWMGEWMDRVAFGGYGRGSSKLCKSFFRIVCLWGQSGVLSLASRI